jgi:hypothetical protein
MKFLKNLYPIKFLIFCGIEIGWIDLAGNNDETRLVAVRFSTPSDTFWLDQFFAAKHFSP